MRERTRVACPETKEQVIEKWIKTWDTLMFLHTELKDLVERMTIRIQHINDDTDPPGVPARTGVDAPDDLDSRGNTKTPHMSRMSIPR